MKKKNDFWNAVKFIEFVKQGNLLDTHWFIFSFNFIYFKFLLLKKFK